MIMKVSRPSYAHPSSSVIKMYMDWMTLSLC